MKKLLFYSTIIIISTILCAVDYLYDQGLIIPSLLIIFALILLNIKVLKEDDFDNIIDNHKNF